MAGVIVRLVFLQQPDRLGQNRDVLSTLFAMAHGGQRIRGDLPTSARGQRLQFRFLPLRAAFGQRPFVDGQRSLFVARPEQLIGLR